MGWVRRRLIVALKRAAQQERGEKKAIHSIRFWSDRPCSWIRVSCVLVYGVDGVQGGGGGLFPTRAYLRTVADQPTPLLQCCACSDPLFFFVLHTVDAYHERKLSKLF